MLISAISLATERFQNRSYRFLFAFFFPSSFCSLSLNWQTTTYSAYHRGWVGFPGNPEIRSRLFIPPSFIPLLCFCGTEPRALLDAEVSSREENAPLHLGSAARLQPNISSSHVPIETKPSGARSGSAQ